MTKAAMPVYLWLLLGIVLTFLSFLLILNPVVNETVKAGSAAQRIVKAGSGYELTEQLMPDIYPIGPYQAIIEQGGLLFLDAKGREQAWHETGLRAARIIYQAADYLVLGDNESPGFAVVNETGIVFSDKIKSRAMSADIRGDDLLLLDQGQDSKGEIRYYNLAAKELIFTIEYQDSGYPLLARLVPGLSAADILVLNTDEFEPRCLMQRYDLNGKLLSELDLGHYFGGFIHYGQKPVVYGQDLVALVNLESKEIENIPLPAGFSYILTDRTGFILLGSRPGEDGSWFLPFASGKESALIEIPLLTAKPAAADGWLLIPSVNNLSLYDLTDIQLAGSEDFPEALKEIYFSPAGRVLIVTGKRIIPYLVQ